ncbi:hypothetical protein HFD88_005868 [Aspergillus terreus]|jgi:hypothetical protein|nr:hypothetical protein HFD88_005868 [Aspergillus terreus]
MPSSNPAPTTLSPDTLETDLLTHLASTTALEDLHATLLCALQRTGWTERIRHLAQELLRAGRCERFDEVVAAVVASAEGRAPPSALLDPSLNGDGDADLDSVDVRIPEAVVQQGVRALKEVLREVVVLEDEAELDEGLEGPAPAREDGGASEKPKKNGESSPVKKTEKKPKPGKQVK